MEIVKRGTPPSDRDYEATCRTCGSVLKFKRSEAKFNADQRDGDFLTVACPVCGANVYANVSFGVKR